MKSFMERQREENLKRQQQTARRTKHPSKGPRTVADWERILRHILGLPRK